MIQKEIVKMSNPVTSEVLNDPSLAQSPLHHADLDSLAAHTRNGGVILHEAKLLGHLNLRGNAQDPAFVAGVEQALGLALPVTPCSSAVNGETQILWLAPDEWMIIVASGTESEVEADLRAKLSGHFAVSDISGAQTIVNLAGKDVINLMKKSTGYDMHLDSFPVGKVIGTTFAQAGAIIKRTGELEFQLVIRRSFSDYIWLWIQQASLEYGLTINK